MVRQGFCTLNVKTLPRTRLFFVAYGSCCESGKTDNTDPEFQLFIHRGQRPRAPVSSYSLCTLYLPETFTFDMCSQLILVNILCASLIHGSFASDLCIFLASLYTIFFMCSKHEVQLFISRYRLFMDERTD